MARSPSRETALGFVGLGAAANDLKQRGDGGADEGRPDQHGGRPPDCAVGLPGAQRLPTPVAREADERERDHVHSGPGLARPGGEGYRVGEEKEGKDRQGGESDSGSGWEPLAARSDAEEHVEARGGAGEVHAGDRGGGEDEAGGDGDGDDRGEEACRPDRAGADGEAEVEGEAVFGEVAGEDRATEEKGEDCGPAERGDEAGGAAELRIRDVRPRQEGHAGVEEAHRERGDEEGEALDEVAAEEEGEAAHGQFPFRAGEVEEEALERGS